MMIKAGDKVRVIKDVESFCDTIKKGDVVEIESIAGIEFRVKGHGYNDEVVNDKGGKFFLLKEEFEPVEEPEDKKYIWYLDSEDGTYFINDLLGVDKWCSHEIQEIKKGKDACYLLTEEEARQSPFFDKFKKHDLFEELFYIRMKGSKGYLNLDTNNNVFFAYSNALFSYKYEFTEEECNEIIGTSSILYKELVNEK
ncbi:MAG: hypothetical protein RR603_00030 [Kurthia sp.]